MTHMEVATVINKNVVIICVQLFLRNHVDFDTGSYVALYGWG